MTAKQMMTAALVIGGVVVGYFALKGRALANLIFGSAQLQTIEFQNSIPVIVFSVLAQNTNSTGVVLNSIAGNLYAQDGNNWSLIGNVSNFTPQSIAGNAETPITLTCRASLIGIVNEIIQAFQFSNTPKQLRCNLTANIDGIQYPVPPFTFQVGV